MNIGSQIIQKGYEFSMKCTGDPPRRAYLGYKEVKLLDDEVRHAGITKGLDYIGGSRKKFNGFEIFEVDAPSHLEVGF